MLTQIRKQKGFTLIELMIVVAIIGILAAVAIPAYTDYLKRSKVGEAVSLMGGLKSPMEEYFGAESEWPSSITSDLGGKIKGKYTSLISLVPATSQALNTTATWGTYSLVAAMKDVPAEDGTAEGEVGMAYNAATKTWACTTNTAESGVTKPLGSGLVPSNCRKAPSAQ